MKQFAKSFLSILLLLSIAAAVARAVDQEATPPAGDAATGETFTTGDTGTGTFTDNTETFTDATFTDETETTGAITTEDRDRDRDRDDERCRGRFCQGTLYLPHPQGLNSARFFNPFWYGPDADRCFNFDIGYRFRQSRKGERIARCLFGNDVLVFSGSEANHRQGELLADNFGLAKDFRRSLRFDPRIRDHMIDFSARWNLGGCMECFEGAYFQLQGTFVHTTWDLRPCSAHARVDHKKHDTTETKTQTDTNTTHKTHGTTQASFSEFPPGYVSKQAAQSTNDLVTALSGDFLFGDAQEKWRFGRFSRSGRDHDTKLANIDIILGYDFMLCDDYHFGAFLVAVAPTGTRPDARKVFQPIAGNGHHWEFGGGIDAHYELWNCDDQSLGLYLNGRATHLFKDTQWRTFGLRGTRKGEGCLSQYTLLKEFDENGIYNGHLIPGVNFTTRRIKSSFSVQGDAALRLLYRSCGWAVGVGYNVFGRSREKLRNVCEVGCTELNGRRFGVKGTTNAWENQNTKDTTTGPERTCTDPLNFEPNSQTQSEFRVKGALVEKDDNNPVFVNCPRDFRFDGEGPEIRRDRKEDTTTLPTEDAGRTDNTRTEDRREDREDNRFERHGILSQVGHKVFGTIDYQWENCDWMPYVGVGGEVEFAQKGKCRVCTGNFWGAWVRAGVNY